MSWDRELAVAREAVREWATDGLHPWDLVAVAAYRGKAGAEELIANALQNPELLQSLASAPNPDGDAESEKE